LQFGSTCGTMRAIVKVEQMAVESEAEVQKSPEGRFCPECGADESGYFCRNCGTLLRGRDRVLCPRCRQVVPKGEFCNQCGQALGGIAPNLQQLALAGEDFWVSATGPALAASAPGNAELGLQVPDESMRLAEAELPDWLAELPAGSVPTEVKARVYPSLKPIEAQDRPSSRRGRALTLVILLLGLLLLSLIILAVALMLRGGG
jgi:hypothetical protein